MVDQQRATLDDLVKHIGRYPEEAFLFAREGLGFAAEQVHGPETDAHRILQQFLIQHDLDWQDLEAEYHTGNLPEPIREAIDDAGGCERLNRHISGRELCWGLRDYALKRWGILAHTVLESWNIQRTDDFGRIIFAFIDFDMMRRQEEDSLEDFREVYDFQEAFDELNLDRRPGGDSEPDRS